MRESFISAIAVAATAFFAVSANAATIDNVSGVYDESGRAVSNAPSDAVQWRDFDETAGNPQLNIVGDTHIFGFVAHRSDGDEPRFTDQWAMNFGTDQYRAVFRWTNLSSVFDGQFVVNGAQHLLGASGEIELGLLTDTVQFNLDPIFGSFGVTPNERANWEIQVQAVPLPAGGLLMLSGLAGLAMVRRRKRSGA